MEAVIGVGLLGLITAAAATLLPAALEAEARSRAHRAALMAADTLLEVGAAGIHGSSAPPPSPLDGVLILDGPDGEDGAPPSGPFRPTCEAAGPDGRSATVVDVRHGARSDGRDVVLSSGPRVAMQASGAHNDLILRLAGEGDIEELVVLDPNGEAKAAEHLGDGCSVLRDLPRGTSWIGATDGPVPLVDRLHVSLAQRPLPVTLDGRPHARRVDVAPAGWLRVDIDQRGARGPDHAANGPLRWFVRGDDANLGLLSGGSRAVHPGVIDVVVPPCADSTATGSTGSVLIGPEEESSIEIALAVVTIENVREHSEAWLQVQRTTECADGTRSRPVLRFEGDLYDGMRIALPRGTWDAWLRRPGSGALTGSVRFSATDADVVVRLP